MSRLVMVQLPNGTRDAVLSLLDDEGIPYSLAEDSGPGDNDGVAFFPLPVGGVEPVLEELRSHGIDDRAVTVVVDTETVISDQFEELEDRYEQEEEDPERIAREELISSAESLAPTLWNYVLLTMISAVIATAGLLLDSPAIVVGSMVIAPLIGPAMTTNVGTVFRENELFYRGLKLQLTGMVVAVVSATGAAYLIKTLLLVPPDLDIFALSEIKQRLRPDFLSLLVALGSGAAGAMSLSSGFSSALVGVMIAVALIPPAATIGIGIAWWKTTVILGSGVLLLVNLHAINLSALMVLWMLGYQPSSWFQIEPSRRDTLVRLGLLLAGLLVLAAFLGGITYSSYKSATVEQTIQQAVASTLEKRNNDLQLLESRFHYPDYVFYRYPDRIFLTLGGPEGGLPPALAGAFREQIKRSTGRNVDIQVRYLVLGEP